MLENIQLRSLIAFQDLYNLLYAIEIKKLEIAHFG